MKILIVLTQYRRNHLEKQLIQIHKQSIKPDYLVVFQNENHVDITNLKNKYNFIHIKSDYNTKYFGRFAVCFTFPVDICMIFDDDIIVINNDPEDVDKSYNPENIIKLFPSPKGKPKTPEEQQKSKAQKEQLNIEIKELLDAEREFDMFDEAKTKVMLFVNA